MATWFWMEWWRENRETKSCSSSKWFFSLPTRCSWSTKCTGRDDLKLALSPSPFLSLPGLQLIGMQIHTTSLTGEQEQCNLGSQHVQLLLSLETKVEEKGYTCPKEKRIAIFFLQGVHFDRRRRFQFFNPMTVSKLKLCLAQRLHWSAGTVSTFSTVLNCFPSFLFCFLNQTGFLKGLCIIHG